VLLVIIFFQVKRPSLFKARLQCVYDASPRPSLYSCLLDSYLEILLMINWPKRKSEFTTFLQENLKNYGEFPLRGANLKIDS